MQYGKESNLLVIRLDDGESVHTGLEQALGENMVKSAVVLGGVGMITDFKLGFYDGKDYIIKEFKEPHELVSLQGSVAHGSGGQLLLHLHCAVADKEKVVSGGHLLSAKVKYMNELAVLRFVDVELGRHKNERTGLMELEIKKSTDIKLSHGGATKHRSGSLELDLD